MELASLWGRDCPIPSGSGCCRPASLLGVGFCTQLVSSPLVFIHSFVLWAGQAVATYTGNFSLSLPLFFPLCLMISQLVFLPHVSSLRLSSGHSGLVPTLSTDVQPVPPCLLTGNRCQCLGHFSAGSCI